MSSRGAHQLAETAHIVDAETGLVGIVNGAEAGRGRPAVILINAGLLHRVGPNRLNTDLARRLGRAGFCSLRIDISGLGDSQMRFEARDNLELVSIDLQRAMDFLQSEYGCTGFILMGLCSGAYDALRKAETDERVVGLVNLDGTGYRTRRFYLNHVFKHLLPRAIEPWRWQRLLHRRASLQASERETGPAHDAASPGSRSGLMNLLAFTDLSRDESARLIESLARRSVHMLFLYTGGVSGYYNYHGQFDDMFPHADFRGMVSHCYFPDSDHLLMLASHRDAVHQAIVNWVAQHFAS